VDAFFEDVGRFVLVELVGCEVGASFFGTIQGEGKLDQLLLTRVRDKLGGRGRG
jgi:hypothetical protein